MDVHIVVYTTTQIATALLCDLRLSVVIICPLWTDAHCARQIEKASNDLLNTAAFGKESCSMLVMLSNVLLLLLSWFIAILLSTPVNEQIILFI